MLLEIIVQHFLLQVRLTVSPACVLVLFTCVITFHWCLLIHFRQWSLRWRLAMNTVACRQWWLRFTGVRLCGWIPHGIIFHTTLTFIMNEESWQRMNIIHTRYNNYYYCYFVFKTWHESVRNTILEAARGLLSAYFPWERRLRTTSGITLSLFLQVR